MADRILGSQFLEDIAEFFLNFQSMYDGFVERARALGMSRTTFRNASGLPDPDQWTTARDMALLGVNKLSEVTRELLMETNSSR